MGSQSPSPEKSSSPNTKTDSPRQLKLSERLSPELVLGFSGTIGCGMSLATDQARQVLSDADYDVQIIKISHIIEQTAKEFDIPVCENTSNKSFERYESLQDAGNKLRKKFSTRVLAEIAIAQIAAHRSKYLNNPEDVKDLVPKKVAYIIHQLKNPAEVELLREIYGDLFYLVGVFANESTRRTNLSREMTAVQAQNVMDRDREEEYSHGQKLDKTLRLSDLFIRSNRDTSAAVTRQLKRLLNLVHGKPSQTPSTEEFAMYAAYSAGLRSACLSNQVGAAICDANGQLVSTGCNDVPKFGGGLYTQADGENDHRCYLWDKKICWNDHTKDELRDQITAIVSSEEIYRILEKAGFANEKQRNISLETATEIADKIRNKTRLKGLLEFSRAVHAEMDAIVGVARVGGPSLIGSSLFTTTFPCHNCARHIVAAGITKVYYIDPYEKSLALDLHADAISDESKEENASKVQFLHFEGISPKRYQQMFSPNGERKEDGKLVDWQRNRSPKGSSQYLDSYIELELRVVEDLNSLGLTSEQLAKIAN
jgi:deoxycytidylate deaminase